MLTALIFIIVLCVLVLIHELGHFVFAKLSGMKVEEFGFGFPPRLFGLQKIDGKWKIRFGYHPDLHSESTIYSVNLIPLGGFVKIFGENGGEEKSDSFSSKSFIARFATLFAGVGMNVVLAWFLITLSLVIGTPVSGGDLPKEAVVTDHSVVISDVTNESPAEAAGLKAGDKIVRVDDLESSPTVDFRKYILDHSGQTFTFNIEREGQEESYQVNSVKVTPGENKPSVGIMMNTTGSVRLPLVSAVKYGGIATYNQLSMILGGIKDLFTTKDAVKSLGGPVKIAQVTGEVARDGFTSLLQFASFLSLNLAVLNVLPIPALDGGRIFFLFIELVRRKKNNAKIENAFNTFGFLFLLLLMLVVTIKDLSGLW